MKYAIEILEEQRSLLIEELRFAEGKERDEAEQRLTETNEALNELNTPTISLSDSIERRKLLKGFADWQKKYKDSSHINIFDYKEYLKTL